MQVFVVVSMYDVPNDDHNGTVRTVVDVHDVYSDAPRAELWVENAPVVGARPGPRWERKYFIVPREVL